LDSCEQIRANQINGGSTVGGLFYHAIHFPNFTSVLPSPKMRSAAQTKSSILRDLRSLADPKVRAKMSYFGIDVKKAHGISVPELRRLANKIGKNHKLANELWASGIHEAKSLAGMIGESEKVTAAQMDRWARNFDSWDVVDGTCCDLFVHAAPAWKKAVEWSSRKEEFVKRAAFSLMAYLSYKDKSAPDEKFLQLLTIIKRESCDDRHFVKKSVNWALRNIGKRNPALNRAAIRTAQQIRAQDSSTARWIAADALRELISPVVQRRLAKKRSK
jgi:3-methyladenine DNA glycosylase AlkD